MKRIQTRDAELESIGGRGAERILLLLLVLSLLCMLPGVSWAQADEEEEAWGAPKSGDDGFVLGPGLLGDLCV